MSAAVAILVILSALAHAAWNAILKRTKDPEHTVVGVMTAAALTAGLVCLALGSPLPSRGAAGALAAIGFAVFLAAMAHAGAGVVLTLRNTSIPFAQIFAFFMGEKPRRLVAGAVLVTVGAVLLAK